APTSTTRSLEQMPAPQLSPGGQTWLQEPQWFASELVSTHSASQTIPGGLHADIPTHSPSTHFSSIAHGLLHAPQWSDAKLKSASHPLPGSPSQSSYAPVQPTTVQEPPVQPGSAFESEQAASHAPQSS